MIATLQEIKNLLNIGDNSKDGIINMYLSITESDVVNYTKNDFGIKEYTTTSISNGVISCINTDLATNKTIIFKSGINKDVPFTIVTRTATKLTVNQDIEDETTENSFYLMKYPNGLKLIQAQMINWLMTSSIGVKSESIGQYSVTYDLQSTAYPQQIWNALTKYSKYYKREE